MMYLQEMVTQGLQQTLITLTKRLPHFLVGPCHLNVNYQITAEEDFFLLHLHVKSNLLIECQRCLDEFNCLYDNKTVVAICRDESRAEQLMKHYECIVSSNFQINLEEVLSDELHLYVPQFHTEFSDCGRRINYILDEKS